VTTTSGVARAVSRGGRGVAWAFLIPVMVVAIYVIDDVAPWRGRQAALEEPATDIATAVLCVVLWYLFLGRLPNRAAVNNVRRQTADAPMAFGVDIFTRPQRSARYLARFSGSIPSIVVVSESALQLWGGRGDSARPVSTIRWNDVQEVSAVGGRWSSLIAVRTSGNTLPFILCLVENRYFATLRVRGRLRAQVIARAEALRTGATPEREPRR